MSGRLEDGIQRWTVKRKSALVIEIIQGKTTAAEARRAYDLTPSEIENWAGQDGWATMALVMGCHTRELLGWHSLR